MATHLNQENLKQTKGLVFDMDGKLILGDKKNNSMNRLPGSAEFISLLIENNIPYVVMTNVTTPSPKGFVQGLSEAGIPMARDNGALSIYVHTGTGGPDAFLDRDQSTWPNISVANVGELMALYQDA